MGMRPSRPVSQARDDVNASQRSSLLPWDNMGVSSSTNGDAGAIGVPGSEGGNHLQVDHVIVKYASTLIFRYAFTNHYGDISG